MQVLAVKSRSIQFLSLLLAFAAGVTLLTYSETEAQTASSAAPSAPALTAQATEGGVELRWEAEPTAVRYVLLTWWDAETGWQPLGGDNLTGTTYTHSEVSAGTKYFYTIRAVNAAGETSGWLEEYASATALAATATLTPTPTATASGVSVPSTPALTAQATEGGVELRWQAVQNAVRYELLTWWDKETGWQPLGGDNLTGSSYRHSEVSAGTKYFYSIRAVNGAGETSGWLLDYASATALATTGDATATPTATRTAATDRDALIAFHEATGGANWIKSHNWLTGAPLSDWYGVTTDASGRVTELRLVGNLLRGSIPDLGALTSLANLNLENNELRGSIPDLSALTSLRYLNLGHNFLSGQIPDLSAFTSLTYLNLFANELSGPIPDLGALTSLRYLELSRNKLSGTIPDLSALRALAELNLFANDLSGPIPDLSALTRLRVMSLGRNDLSGPIPDLSAVTSLEYLELQYNELSGQIPDLSALTRLRRLDLQHNQLTGPVPNLTRSSLLELNLGGNQLCAPPGVDFSRGNQAVAAHFRTLNLSTCTGVAPPAAAPAEEKEALAELYRATDGANWKHNANWLTSAPVGTWHGVFTDVSGHVIELRLEQNQLRGTLPALKALTRLTTLYLYENELTGPIPELNALTNLKYVWLSDNRFSGPIPALNSLTNLSYLDLSYNRLTGPIPDLSELTHLQQLILGYNQLTGSIPDLSANIDLSDVDLSDNRLTGPIQARRLPPDLWDLTLGSNQLSGPFPDLSAHTNLEYLDLYDNQLTGPIPGLSTFTNLWHLYLGNNRLTGSIPDLSALTELRSLALGGNQLTGSIPDLSTLTELDYLRLDNNRLTGPIPDLSALTKLTSLNLEHNRLTGPILNLSDLTRLTYLSLRYNQFTGPVPDLSALTNLTSLSLRGNRLCLGPGSGLSGANRAVTEHLNSLNLPACTAAELALTPGAPKNLTATVGDGRVTLRWSAAPNAAGYELRVWDSINREWGGIGGDLRVTSHTHTVLKDGRNYYYQVRARDVNGVFGPWSEQVYAAVVTPRYPPPPSSLGVDMLYQKYVEANGVAVVAPSEVFDAKMALARETVTGMLSSRADLLRTMAANNMIIFIESANIRGIAYKIPGGWEAYVRANDPYCENFIHEFAHVIHFAIEEQAGGPAFNARLLGLYQSALNAGLWAGTYASFDAVEYWAETVVYWLWGYAPYTGFATLADYDPEIAKLIEEELDGATVPAACKP